MLALSSYAPSKAVSVMYSVQMIMTKQVSKVDSESNWVCPQSDNVGAGPSKLNSYHQSHAYLTHSNVAVCHHVPRNDHLLVIDRLSVSSHHKVRKYRREFFYLFFF